MSIVTDPWQAYAVTQGYGEPPPGNPFGEPAQFGHPEGWHDGIDYGFNTLIRVESIAALGIIRGHHRQGAGFNTLIRVESIAAGNERRFTSRSCGVSIPSSGSNPSQPEGTGRAKSA